MVSGEGRGSRVSVHGPALRACMPVCVPAPRISCLACVFTHFRSLCPRAHFHVPGCPRTTRGTGSVCSSGSRHRKGAGLVARQTAFLGRERRAPLAPARAGSAAGASSAAAPAPPAGDPPPRAVTGSRGARPRPEPPWQVFLFKILKWKKRGQQHLRTGAMGVSSTLCPRGARRKVLCFGKARTKLKLFKSLPLPSTENQPPRAALTGRTLRLSATCPPRCCPVRQAHGDPLSPPARGHTRFSNQVVHFTCDGHCGSLSHSGRQVATATVLPGVEGRLWAPLLTASRGRLSP